MRTLVLLFLLGCAAKNANPAAPQPSPEPALTEVQVRACESCRHNLQRCQSSAPTTTSGTTNAECMQDFMTCLNGQQLDGTRCQGVN